MVAAYVGLLIYLYFTNRTLFADMLQLYALTLLAGREPAILAAYQPPTPIPLAWMVPVAVIDDVGTLLLTITWVWFAFHRLHRVRFLQPWLLGLEKSALEHRGWVRRWGMWGLAAFYWLPGFGSGVLAICVIGVIAHIPLRRLIPILVASAVAVSVFWSVLLYYTAVALPMGIMRWLPLAIVAAVLTVSIIGAVRRMRTANILLLEWPAPAPERRPDLEELGIRARDGIVEVDTSILGAALDEGGARRADARWAAELLLLDGMTVPVAEKLVRQGVRGLLDLGVLEPGLVQEAAGVGVDEATARRWQTAALTLGADAEHAWRE